MGIGPNMPKWPALKESLRGFSVVSIRMLQDLDRDGAKCPVRREMVPVRAGNNQWSFETKTTPLYGMLLQSMDNKLKALAEYKECESHLLLNEGTSSHMNTLVGTPHHITFLSIERLVYAVLLDQLVDGHLEFREEKFEHTYGKVEEYFASTSERFVGWVPLKNFTTDIDEVGVDSAVRIRRLPDEVIAELYTYGSSGSFGRIDEVLQWTHGIEVEYELPKIFGGIVEPAEKSLDPIRAAFERPVEDVIRSLRLIKRGVVGIGPKLMKPLTWSPDTGTILTYGYPADVPLRVAYTLFDKDISVLTRLLPLVKELDRQRFSFLELAIRRFNQSYGRVGLDDRLIDNMIAFEALYLNDADAQERGEMRFRLALRMALFLGEPKQRKSLFREIRAAYDMRSSIVHGDVYELPKIDGEVIPVEEFVARVEDYLRQSIIKFLKLAQGPSPKKKLVLWDDLLFPDALDS